MRNGFLWGKDSNDRRAICSEWIFIPTMDTLAKKFQIPSRVRLSTCWISEVKAQIHVMIHLLPNRSNPHKCSGWLLCNYLLHMEITAMIIMNVAFPSKWQKNNTRDSNVVPHRSTNLARQCLTSLSRREAVLSLWYGRSWGQRRVFGF